MLGTSDPTAVQPHLLKMFNNAAALVFGEGGKTVIGLTSSEVRPCANHGLIREEAKCIHEAYFAVYRPLYVVILLQQHNYKPTLQECLGNNRLQTPYKSTSNGM